MSFPSESDMMSKELQNSDLIYKNLRTDVFKIIVKYRPKIIAKYRHLSPSGNRALEANNVDILRFWFLFSQTYTVSIIDYEDLILIRAEYVPLSLS